LQNQFVLDYKGLHKKCFYTSSPVREGQNMKKFTTTTTGYKIFKPLSFGDYERMDKKQARESCELFIKQIPLRLSELNRVITQSTTDVVLDFSPESFFALGNWLDQSIVLRPLTSAELLKAQKELPSWLYKELPTTVKTKESRSLCFDVGIYFGEIFRRKYAMLRWDFVQKPKNDGNLNRPVIISFDNKHHLNPIVVISNAAGKVWNDISAEDAWVRLFNIWTKYFLGEESLETS
jgi:hypothetical protein